MYSDYEWAKEWDDIVVMASPEPRQQASSGVTKSTSRRRSFALERHNSESIDDNATYESLEEIHVLALAHVLRRTIIVVADTMLRDMNGEAMAPITFGGIYMPFEVAPSECHRSPLLLTYDMAHFSALVAMDSKEDFPPSLIPLVDYENKLLPIQFCIDPGAGFDWRTYDGSDNSWTLSEKEHVALLKEYMEVSYAPNPSSPDDEIYEDYWTDEETDVRKQFTDAEVVMSDQEGDATPKSDGKERSNKATRQLQSVAKQFGSIGKNMSKKIKKNFENITNNFKHNNGQSSNYGSQKKLSGLTNRRGSNPLYINKFNKVLCAQLRMKTHEYQREMISNYLECAHARFKEVSGEQDVMAKERRHSDTRSPDLVDDCDARNGTACEVSTTEPPIASSIMNQPQTVALTDAPASLNDTIVNCINPGCLSYGTSRTSYMCQVCYEQQRQREAECKFLETPPRYGTGNSKFYTQTDAATHNQIKRLPSVRGLHELDQTLYLSNSTFYNDKLPPASATTDRQTGKVIQHKIHVEGQDYNRGQGPGQKGPLIDQQSSSSSSSPIRRSGQRNAVIYDDQFNGVLDMIEQADATENHRRPVVPSQNRGMVPSPFHELQAQPCRTTGCFFYGNASTNFFCSKCCQQRSAGGEQQQQQQPKKILADV